MLTLEHSVTPWQVREHLIPNWIVCFSLLLSRPCCPRYALKTSQFSGSELCFLRLVAESGNPISLPAIGLAFSMPQWTTFGSPPFLSYTWFSKHPCQGAGPESPLTGQPSLPCHPPRGAADSVGWQRGRLTSSRCLAFSDGRGPNMCVQGAQ